MFKHEKNPQRTNPLFSKRFGYKNGPIIFFDDSVSLGVPNNKQIEDSFLNLTIPQSGYK